MGLPLYVAPVESDIRPRPAPKATGSLMRQPTGIRRRRAEMLGEAEARRIATMNRMMRAPAPSVPSAPSAPDPTAAAPVSAERGSGPFEGFGEFYAFGEVARRSEGRFQSEQQSRNLRRSQALDRQTQALDRQTEALDRQTRALNQEANALNEQAQVLEERFQALEQRSLELDHPRRRAGRHLTVGRPLSRLRRVNSSNATNTDPSSERDELASSLGVDGPPHRRRLHPVWGWSTSPIPRAAYPPPALPDPSAQDIIGVIEVARSSSTSLPWAVSQPQRVDGLGDRNRSISPEGDWDTLLNTLTPDPQPPSVGSSFASASATASQSTGAGRSFATSLTGRDTTADESEPNCESACEGSDTEGDQDEEDTAAQALGALFPTGSSIIPRQERAWAEVAARLSEPSQSNSSSDESLELSVELGSMQRIMRIFASREDIPDEWWAEVGLRRTLSRATS